MRAWVHLNSGRQPRGGTNQMQRGNGVWAPAGAHELECTSAFSLSRGDGSQDGGVPEGDAGGRLRLLASPSVLGWGGSKASSF